MKTVLSAVIHRAARVCARWGGRARTLLLAGAVTTAAACGNQDGAANHELGAATDTPEGSSSAPHEPVTFYEHVAPLLYEHCVSCHRPGGAAPFSLIDYEAAREYATAIAAVMARGSMPPWLPDTSGPEFRGERRVTAGEIELVERWAADGALAGDPAAAPAPPDVGQGWQLGDPDLVVRLPRPYPLPGGGGEVFRNLVIPSPVEGTRYVHALELRPGDPRVVHHAQVFIDRTGSSRELAARDSGPGFDGMLHPAGVRDADGIFLGWTPGKTPFAGLEGLAWRLDGQTDLVLMLHLRPRQQPVQLQVELGLHFADTPPSRYPAILKLSAPTIDIPAGVSDYAVADSYTLPVDVQVLSVYPHAHYLGRRLEGYARTPDGSTHTLIRIPDWDFNWQDEYRYAEPVQLPRGTVVGMRYTYDNSADNPQNPHDPPRRVVYGPSSTDEMGELLLQVLVKDSASLARLTADQRPRKLEKLTALYEHRLRLGHDSAEAHQNLGLVLQMRGRLEEAVSHYRRALDLQPHSAETYNNLGTALATQGRLEEALAAYWKAVEIQPDNYKAHYNLGLGLQAVGDWPGAADHLRRALRSRPDDPAAHGQLGRVLARLGRLEEAVEHWREASRLDSAWVMPLAEAAWALATHPDPWARRPTEAVELARRAVELTERSDARVLDILGAAYAANGEFERAVEAAEQAVALARVTGDYELADAIAGRLRMYRRGRAYVDGPPGSPGKR